MTNQCIWVRKDELKNGIFPYIADADIENYKKRAIEIFKDFNLKKDWFKLSDNKKTYDNCLIDYSEYDFSEYEYQYKLKNHKLIWFNGLFEHRLIFDSPFCRFRPNESAIILDYIGIDWQSDNNCNLRVEAKNENIIHIPEYIDQRRYVYHKLNDFLSFDFKTYFSENKITGLVYKNVEIWERIFENCYTLDKSNSIKILVKKLCNNPELYFYEKLKKLINKKKTSKEVYF